MNICVRYVKNSVEFGTFFSLQKMQSAAIPVSEKRFVQYALFAFYPPGKYAADKLARPLPLPDLLSAVEVPGYCKKPLAAALAVTRGLVHYVSIPQLIALSTRARSFITAS